MNLGELRRACITGSCYTLILAGWNDASYLSLGIRIDIDVILPLGKNGEVHPSIGQFRLRGEPQAK